MKNDVEIKEEVLRFLKSSNLAVISTVSKSNIPQAALILCMIDDNLNFYCPSLGVKTLGFSRSF